LDARRVIVRQYRTRSPLVQFAGWADCVRSKSNELEYFCPKIAESLE
jgi:hypothetical protein